jgi:methylglutamate dehydrogenase subunit A
MSFPESADFVVIGAGIHGLSTAWHLGERHRAEGKEVSIVVLDKDAIASGASGIACGVVRNNYFQPAMRELMAHSVGVWESDPEAFSYHSVGYLQISCEPMRDDIASIFEQQRAIGYESDFIEGANASTSYMRGIFDDWQAQGITSVLHEKRGGFANNTASMYGLAKKAEDVGVRIISGVTVTAMKADDASSAVSAVVTDKGEIQCGQVVVATGPWVRDFWDMLDLPKTVDILGSDGTLLQARHAFWRHPRRCHAIQGRQALRGCLDRPLWPAISGICFVRSLRAYVVLGAGALSQALRGHDTKIREGTVRRYRLFYTG